MSGHAGLRQKGFVGFAHRFLQRYNEESKSNDEIDIQVYTKLVQLDSKIGTTASEQLYCCLEFTTRSDIIMVKIIVVNKLLKFF